MKKKLKEVQYTFLYSSRGRILFWQSFIKFETSRQNYREKLKEQFYLFEMSYLTERRYWECRVKIGVTSEVQNVFHFFEFAFQLIKKRNDIIMFIQTSGSSGALSFLKK